MLNAIIDFSLRNRLLVIALAVIAGAIGFVALGHLDIDAFPDTTPVQVQINVNAPSLGPEEIERQITQPLEQSLGGLPRIEGLRSVSKFGLSQVVVTFADGTDLYFARQLVTERLASVELPPGIARPTLGPVSTGLGEVFHYTLTYRGFDFSALPESERVRKLTDLRTLQDWVIKPKLRTVRGVAEVNTWGGYEKQFQVRIDPLKLTRYGLTFDRVITALEANNRNVGGGAVRQNSQMLLVHGLGRASSLEGVGGIVVARVEGKPIRVSDVAEVEIGHEVRRGAVTAEGRGEVVLGLCFLIPGENSHRVTRDLRNRLREIETSLPSDVEVTVVYDRTELVDYVLTTVRKNLFEGGLLVVAVLFAFLGNLRAAAIVALAIPLSMLFAFSGMLRFGISASLLSLGAIDFGMVVDSSVVMVENCLRQLAHRKGGSVTEVVRDAAVEVRKPTLFGELIIMIVYLPILTLEGIEGKLFRPMALTVIFALFGSMILSLTLMPVLASLVLPRRIAEREPLLMRLAHLLHNPILRLCMEQRLLVLSFAVTMLVVAFAMIAPYLGSEFNPRLSEGAITVGVVRLAGTDLEESLRVNDRMEKLVLAAFPDEVAHVWSRIGTAEIATDPMGVELTDFFLTLHPREKWRKATTQAELTTLLERELRRIPGQRIAFSQPIEMRMNEMVSGVRSDVGFKLFGDDFKVLTDRAREIEAALQAIPGSADVSAEQVTGQPILQVAVLPDELARHGVAAADVLALVEAVGGRRVGDIVEGQLRFPLVVRLPPNRCDSPAALGAVLLTTAEGEQIPLSRLATFRVVEGPSTITREWGQRRITITANVRGRDPGGFVHDATAALQPIKAALPDGRYTLERTGQYENYERAVLRLQIVVPVVIVSILVLLYWTYGNPIDALRVFTGVPFGWVGGILALWIRDMPFSVSAAIGFIALSGVAVLDDMILVSTIRSLRRRGVAIEEAVRLAAVTRLRPVLMTTLVASLGFLPMAFSTGMGAEVQRPLATVVIGGVIGAMLMSLLVLRVLYLAFDGLAQGLFFVMTAGFGMRPSVARGLLGLFPQEDDDEDDGARLADDAGSLGRAGSRLRLDPEFDADQG